MNNLFLKLPYEDPAIANWLPKRFIRQNDHELNCEWFYLGDKRFEEPFFDETIGICLKHPYNSSFFKTITGMEEAVILANQLPYIEPSAFIFHTSRCGSTLMTQLLSLFPQNIVVPEYPALDQLLRLPLQGFIDQHNQQETWVKACIRLLGQIRFPDEEKLIIKLDCWHLAFFEQIAAWYPDTPKIILYREPMASIASHLKHPGMQAVPNLLELELFGLNSAEIDPANTLLYLNQVFAAMYGQIQNIAANHPKVLLLDYADGVEEMFKQISTTIQLQLDTTTTQRIKKRLAYHSKRGVAKYQEENTPMIALTLACQEAYSQLRHYKSGYPSTKKQG